jgi:hypothetical protein
MVKINIKKYSRSNVNEVDPTDTEASIDYTESISQPKRRGRPKKVTILDQQPDEAQNEPEQTEIQTETYEFEPLEEENDIVSNDPFLDDLNNENLLNHHQKKNKNYKKKNIKSK